jgi:hypothetical protein
LPNYDTLVSLGGPVDWVLFFVGSSNVSDRRKKLGVLFFFWWYVWKEINNRIFNNAESVPRAASVFQEEIERFYQAWRD